MRAEPGEASSGRTALAGGLSRLPSGPHHLSAEEVAASQRFRMLVALGDVTAEKGYAACTITEIVKRAGVSRRTFYEHFRSKEACAIAGFEYGIELVVERMGSAGEAVAEGDWGEYVRSSLDTYLRTLAAFPNAAWGFHVEAVNSGPVIYAVRAQFASVLANRMREAYALARRKEPARPELPDELFDVLLGGIDDRIRHCLHTRSAANLPELLSLLVQATFALFGGGPRDPQPELSDQG